jgi:membrane-bound lytic murein transglycosylase D
MINISVDTLKWLNPSYKLDYVPAGTDNYMLVLPQDKILEYIQQEGRIIANKKEMDDYFSKQKKLSSTKHKVQLLHTVEKGEYFHKIAMRYNCSIESIKNWNDLDTNNIYPGQKLIIWIPEDN